ncbi:ribosomal RNA small subunit methyltransferase H [Clostridia bacterium]|nr:ribosomal RNA small subunit methyltransferase H [Clostridia bacterium]
MHVPVLLEETIENLRIRPNGVYIDATAGGGGHSGRIARELTGSGRLFCVDQDADAISRCREVLSLYGDRVTFIHDNFKNLKELYIGQADGILLDIGVSSFQLDEAGRGFSYQNDAPLDMRMDKTRDFSARDLVNTYDEDELYRIIREYGEERFAGRIAGAIAARRKVAPIETTLELSDIIRKAVPAKYRQGDTHPAKRAFQAIRIEVNEELSILEKAVRDAAEMLKPGGRLALITFHSLEDRIVKTAFRELSVSCKCPKEFPICVCGGVASHRLVTKKPILPTKDEIEKNRRSHSAKLRVIEKL